MFKRIIYAIYLLCYAQIVSPVTNQERGEFSGRVASINEYAKLVRFKVDFVNLKYLNKSDKVEFWTPTTPGKKCVGIVVGKTSKYILAKIPQYKFCLSKVFLSSGAYVRFFAQDLVNNLKMGQEVVNILLKKRLAIGGELTRKKMALDSYVEKVNAVNARFQVLREKLEREWRGELQDLEEDKVGTLERFKWLEIQQDELDFKLEKYKISDKNLRLDRWALDPNQYYSK